MEKEEQTIVLKGDYIKLDQALKFVLGVSGGEAKEIIAGGEVFVNGEPETQRGKKLRDGDEARYKSIKIQIKR